jgi:hypothetical protein
MLNKQKKWSILLHVILLVNVVLIVWVVVFNNSFIIINNIDIWNNQEEAFANIYNKWYIAIDSVKKYNSNGGGFLDGISCPTNITMSWSTNSWSNIGSSMVYSYWTVHCVGDYNGKEFKIFYNEELKDFKSALYEWSVVDIDKSASTVLWIWSDNLAWSAYSTLDASVHYSSNVATNLIDSNLDNSNYYRSLYYYTGPPYVRFTFPTATDIWLIKIYNIIWSKSYRLWYSDLYFYNASNDLIKTINVWDAYWKEILEFNLWITWLKDVKTVVLESTRVDDDYITLREIEIFWFTSNGWEEIWVWSGWINGNGTFSDDLTFMSFTNEWIWWNDNIDDDLNSDNFRVTSFGDVYFPNGYQDDDVVPRKTIFWSVSANDKYNHIYWNNYKTVEYLSGNTNNNDTLNVKMWNIDAAHMFLDTFNSVGQNFDLKILEFDRDIYKNEFTLLPINTNEGKNITDYIWYIQKSSTWSLSLSKEKTGDEFEFDFKTKDYALFIANNTSGLLSYHLSAETKTPLISDTWTWIYINPIDDSGTGTIKILSNHIIIGWEKNFIWENFELVEKKSK